MGHRKKTTRNKCEKESVYGEICNMNGAEMRRRELSKHSFRKRSKTQLQIESSGAASEREQ